MSQKFSITIGDTWTCLTCKAQKSPKTSKDLSLILPFGTNVKKGKNARKISHEKKTHLGKSCVTMTDLMDQFYETNELSDVICDTCTDASGTKQNIVLKQNNR